MRILRATTKLSALAVLATLAATTVLSAYPQAAHAQTYGMDRRADRRENRQDARTSKHDCMANSDTSRAGCRQEKRGEKQEGRHDTTPNVDPVPVTTNK